MIPEIANRNRWLPPRVYVPRVESGDWSRLAPVALLTDPFGEEISPRAARVRLGWSAAQLLIEASVESAGTLLERLPPGHPDFWKQDHLDIRAAAEDDAYGGQVIVALDGRWWHDGPVSRGANSTVSAEKHGASGWTVRAALPWPALGLEKVAAGERFALQLAHLRWDGSNPTFSEISPAPLGFGQRERAALMTLLDDAQLPLDCSVSVGEVLTAGRNRVALTLRDRSGGGFRGRLRAQFEQDGDVPYASLEQAVEVPPSGTARVELDVVLERPAYTRVRLSIDDGSSHRELSAFTLRAPAPPLKAQRARRHPYMLFDATGLAAFRAKAEQPFLASLAAKLDPKDADFDETFLGSYLNGVPPIGERDMNWFRVAKESMLRDGEGGKRKSSRRIWELLGVDAQAALRDVVRTVQTTPQQMRVLLPAFNRLQSLPEFYDAEAFSAVELPEEANRLAARERASLSSSELALLNRTVLQCSIECMHGCGMELIGRISRWFACWLRTGDERFIGLATRAARTATTALVLPPFVHLHEGGAGTQLAMAYDAFHPHLSEEDRQRWQQLLKRFLEIYLATARRWHWCATAIPNANPVDNGGMGCVALAMLDEEPAMATEALCWARKFIWNFLDWCVGPDGGNTEGAQYWQYGTESLAHFALMLERATGSDDGIFAHPAFARAMAMVRVGLCNDGSMHGMNDTVPMPVGAEIAWLVARRGHDAELAGWYGDHALRLSREAATAGRLFAYHPDPVFSLVVRDDAPERLDAPPFPALYVVESIQYGILRSSPQWDCRWSVCVKGSRPPYTHHNQPDTGAISVDLAGERLLIDPGYYKDKPEHHCLPLIGGRGPVTPSAWTGRIFSSGECGALRWIAIDSTAAYAGVAERVRRWIVLNGEAGVVVLDDIVPANPAAPVTSQWQCGGTVEMDGESAVLINGERARMRLALDGAKPVIQPERTLHDVHWGYHFARCRHFPVLAKYAAAAATPLVAVATEMRASNVRREQERIVAEIERAVAVSFVRDGAGMWTLV